MNLFGQAQLAFSLGLLLSQDVIEMGLGPFEAALTRPPKALGGAPVSLHLGHDYLHFWPCYERLFSRRYRRVVAFAGDEPAQQLLTFSSARGPSPFACLPAVASAPPSSILPDQL